MIHLHHFLFQIKTMRTPSSTTRKPWSWTRAMPSTTVTGVWRTCAPSAMAMRWRTPRKPWSWTRTTLRATIGEPPPTWPWASLKPHLKITKRWDSLYSQHFNIVLLDAYWCTEVSASKHIRLKRQYLLVCWSRNSIKAMSFVNMTTKKAFRFQFHHKIRTIHLVLMLFIVAWQMASADSVHAAH